MVPEASHSQSEAMKLTQESLSLHSVTAIPVEYNSSCEIFCCDRHVLQVKTDVWTFAHIEAVWEIFTHALTLYVCEAFWKQDEHHAFVLYKRVIVTK